MRSGSWMALATIVMLIVGFFIANTSGADKTISRPHLVVVNAPASPSSGMGLEPSVAARVPATTLAAAQVNFATNNSAQGAQVPPKSVEAEPRDAVWANPTERELREQARRIPAVDDGAIVTRCASSVCDLIVHASAYASPEEKKAFTKYVQGDALPMSLANTNAMLGDVQIKTYDNRLTALIALDRIHR
jgi:hypothetical protein